MGNGGANWVHGGGWRTGCVRIGSEDWRIMARSWCGVVYMENTFLCFVGIFLY